MAAMATKHARIYVELFAFAMPSLRPAIHVTALEGTVEEDPCFWKTSGNCIGVASPHPDRCVGGSDQVVAAVEDLDERAHRERELAHEHRRRPVSGDTG